MLPIAIGNDGHDDIVADLSAMPHLLIGGCDGYGKTTFLRNAINLISGTESSKLILVDSKDDDFKDYSNLDCLACPIIHDFGALVEKLEWLLEKLEERYYLFLLLRVAGTSLNTIRKQLRRCHILCWSWPITLLMIVRCGLSCY